MDKKIADLDALRKEYLNGKLEKDIAERDRLEKDKNDKIVVIEGDKIIGRQG